MDKKKTKRSKSKTQSDGHGHGRSTVKKKPTEVTTEKEEQERLEAANILSSLKFMAPLPSDEPKTVPAAGNVVKSTELKVTYLPSSSTTGISNPSTPSLKPQGRQPVVGGGAASLAVLSRLSPAVLTQLTQLQASMGTSLLSLLTMRPGGPVPVAKTQTSDSKVPSVVMSAEPSRLPLTLNPVKTVNKSVATALRQAVAQNTVKQEHEPSVMISINEKIEKKDIEELNSFENQENGSENPENGSHSIEDKSNTSAKKKDSTENSLPLKKRRLVSLLDPLTSDLGSSRLSDLATAVQMENILNLARDYPDPSAPTVPSVSLNSNPINDPSMSHNGAATNVPTEGYRPMKFDPRTSLLVLSDLKAALTPDEDGDLPIHIAVVHKNTELVKKFIDIMAMSGKSVDRYNKLQQTPLHLAVLVDKADIVEALLGANADPNLMDRNGCTSTHIAITKHFPACLETIFTVSRKRVEVNTRNYEGYSPLHTAVELKDFEAMQFLNEKGASIYINLNIQDGKAGRSVLFYATEYKRVQMVDYLIKCGVNVDLQNYAGVSALMTAQAGGFDAITQLLTQALESQKLPEDGYSSQPKKIPIAPIPSKAKLIVQDSQLLRSRSNSLSFDVKPAPLSRTSSTSSTSPMDLSLTRKNKSPSYDQIRRGKPNSFYTEPIDKSSVSWVDKLASKVMKEKHAQIIAALEGRNILSRQFSSVPSDLYPEHCLEDFSGANKAKIKEEPIDIDGNGGQSAIQEMDTQETHGRNDIFPNGRDKTGSEMEVTTYDATFPVLLKPSSTERHIDNNNMQVNNSPSMPVLSRAISLTEKSNDTNTIPEILRVSDSPDSVSSEPRVSTNIKQHHFVDFTANPSSNDLRDSDKLDTTVLSDESMEVDSDIALDTDNNEAELSEERHSPINDKLDDINEGENVSENIDMDINAIEMDAEHEEDEEGLLIIDENGDVEKDADVSIGLSADRKDTSQSSCEVIYTNHSEEISSQLPEQKRESVALEKLKHTDSEISLRGSVKVSSPVTMTENSFGNAVFNLDKQKHNIHHSKGIPENFHKSNSEQDDDDSQEIEESVPLSTLTYKYKSVEKTNDEQNANISARTGIHNTYNTDIDLSKEKRNNLAFSSGIENDNSKTKTAAQSTPSLKHVDQTEHDNVSSNCSDKTLSKDAAFTVGHSRTLYVREGDNYKPIKIFIDDSVQSSLVLQRMLEQASVMPGVNPGNLHQVNSENKQGKDINSAVLLQQPPITTAISSSSHANVASSNVPLTSHANVASSYVPLTSHVPLTRHANVASSNVPLTTPVNKSSKHIHAVADIPEIITTNAGVSTSNIAQIDAMMKVISRRMVELNESKIKSQNFSESSFGPAKQIQVGDIQCSVTMPSNKEANTVKTFGWVRDVSNSEINKSKVVNSSEHHKINTTDKTIMDHTKTTCIDRTVTHSPVKASVSQKPPSSATNRKPSIAVSQQAKVTSFLQNRATVSTSEGTLTWVNPDIKSRLSKALQSPQRKTGGKVIVAGQDVETNLRNIASHSVDGHLEHVQTAIVSDTGQ